MKTAIYNGKLITPAEVLENKVLVLENDRIIDILAEDVIDLGQYDEKSMRTEGMSVQVLSILILTRSNRSFSRVLPV